MGLRWIRQYASSVILDLLTKFILKVHLPKFASEKYVLNSGVVLVAGEALYLLLGRDSRSINNLLVQWKVPIILRPSYFLSYLSYLCAKSISFFRSRSIAFDF